MGRLLWDPLHKQLHGLPDRVKDGLRTSPVQTMGCIALILPISGLILLALPGLLIADALVQTLYNAHQSAIDVAVEDTSEILALWRDATRIWLKHTGRAIRRVALTLLDDPVGTARTVFGWLWWLITNPLTFMLTLWHFFVGASIRVIGAVTYMWTVVREQQKHKR